MSESSAMAAAGHTFDYVRLRAVWTISMSALPHQYEWSCYIRRDTHCNYSPLTTRLTSSHVIFLKLAHYKQLNESIFYWIYWSNRTGLASTSMSVKQQEPWGSTLMLMTYRSKDDNWTVAVVLGCWLRMWHTVIQTSTNFANELCTAKHPETNTPILDLVQLQTNNSCVDQLYYMYRVKGCRRLPKSAHCRQVYSNRRPWPFLN